MTWPAWFDHLMMYVWAGYILVLFGFLVWAGWVFAIDEPRRKRRSAAYVAKLQASLQRRQP